MANQFQVDTDGTLLTSLEAYYALEESTGATRADSSVNGRDMTDNNSVSQITGKVGNGAGFTEANSTYLSNTGFLDNPSVASWAFWLKNTATNGRPLIWRNNENSSSPNEYRGWEITNKGQSNIISCSARNDGSNVKRAIGSTTVNNGSWHFVICTWTMSGNVWKIYVDNGADEASDPGSSGTVTNTSNSRPVNIGAQTIDATYYDGNLDEIGIWSKILSTQERTDLWNGGNGQTMVPPTINQPSVLGGEPYLFDKPKYAGYE